MAARENQGYLIAVIILVLLTLILALAAFLGISKASEYADSRDSANQQLAVQKNLTSALSIHNDILKAMIGELGPSVDEIQVQRDSMNSLVSSNFTDSQKSLINDVIASVDEVRAVYDADMNQYIAADEDDASKPTWRSLTANLATVLNDKHNDTFVLRNDIARIQKETASAIAQRDADLKKARDAVEVARTELQTEKDRFRQKEQTLQAENEKIIAQNEASNQALENATESFKKIEADLKRDVADVTVQKDALKVRVDRYEREVFDLPDGLIVRASPKINSVVVNIGREDGLRPNRKFAVYDASETNFVDGLHKATIEITDINGAHQAVGRITNEDPLNPILKGDKILAATWDPGYRVPIALVGKFDLDNDGRSDLGKLVSMIERNGGRVVAQHDEDGNIKGKIDATTRYLVLGQEPDVGANSNPQVLSAIKTLMDQGSENSVQQIDTRKLLNWMGQHGQAKIERLDNRMGEEFRRRDPISSLKSRDR